MIVKSPLSLVLLLVGASFMVGCPQEPNDFRSGDSSDASDGDDEADAEDEADMMGDDDAQTDDDEEECVDLDFDDLCDADEATYGTDPNVPDTDGDGLEDGREIEDGTDPLSADTDGDGLSDGDEVKKFFSDPLIEDTDGDGASDFEEAIVGSDPSVVDEACITDTKQASSTSAAPVDIIIGIDTSESMTEEIWGVEQNINVNFASILGNSGLDYRIIMIAEYGNGSLELCISTPLSGESNCSSPAYTPADTDQFKHLDEDIYSTDGLEIMLDSYNSWEQWLRPGAVKAFLFFSDDDSWLDFQSFDSQLRAKSSQHFGTATNRNYVFHSVVGLQGKADPTSPWLPAEGIQYADCGYEAVNAGLEYQSLSILTGGQRYPLCNHDNFDSVFQGIAQGVIQQTNLPCQYQPDAPAGEIADFNGVLAYYTPGDGSDVMVIDYVSEESVCGGSPQYFIDGNTIHLCPTLCEEVSNDLNGQLEFHVACEGDLGEDCVGPACGEL